MTTAPAVIGRSWDEKLSSLLVFLTRPSVIALGVAAIYAIRFINCLPFSGFTRQFNYETITTLASYLIYAGEPLSFPLGTIMRLTFPFQDANAGNVGALPLFAVFFKVLGLGVPYFRTFDYFALVEIMSAFFTAYFAQLILAAIGVQRATWRALGALLTATSMLMLGRSAWLQPFCVVGFPLFMAWMYGMLAALSRTHWRPGQDALILSIFPIASLTDNYTLFGLMLGTGVLALREMYEALFGELPASRNRLARLLFYCVGGAASSVLCLYIIGMYPLPAMTSAFTSYDFGAGGRYHVADLLAPLLPIGTKLSNFLVPALPTRFGFPMTTDNLDAGQYEGVGYIGTPVLLAWIAIIIAGAISVGTRGRQQASPMRQPIVAIYSPWTKIFWACFCVFLFSLGYELHVLGKPLPNFAGMPAAWLADRVKSLYNFRAPGRLASLFSLYLMLEAVRRLSRWQDMSALSPKSWLRNLPWSGVLGVIALLHLAEIAPLLKPVPSQKLHPVGGIFSEQDIGKLRALTPGHDAILIAPSVLAIDTNWTATAFSLAYHTGIKSNLYYVARVVQEHADVLAADLIRVLAGDWDALSKDYGNVLFAIPVTESDRLRARMSDRYQETIVGPVAIWSKR